MEEHEELVDVECTVENRTRYEIESCALHLHNGSIKLY
jgi:hypothetical protein